MKVAQRWLWASLIALGAGALQAATDPEINYEKFTLDNGLTLIVHEDNKAPIVAVNVWYHVGSKNEKEGKTGFAHLFEHLMFNGTENYNDEYFKPFESVGATGMNGTTNFDRTNYFQEVPKNAIDLALWMESDRMGHLLGAIDQAKLDEQRGVVQNEKRQGENQPYGKVFIEAFKNIFPKGHPYSWSVIGYMEDLNAASIDDVHQWFKQYYGAANATIVLAGDIAPQEAKAKVEKFFGHIPAGPPLTKHDAWIPELSGSKRQVMQDRVPQARLYKFYMMPEMGQEAANHLDLVSGILSEGKTSRLYKRLVYQDQIARDVSSFAFPLEIAGLFGVIATAMPGQDLADVEKVIDEEVARFLKDGPTRDELARIKTTRRASFLRGIERIGGFGGKSDILAQNQVYMNDPGYFRTTLKRWDDASTADLKAAANEWIAKGSYTLEVQPFDSYEVAETDQADRSKLPDSGTFPSVQFDEFERSKLSNGLEVVLAQRSAIPVVNMRLLVDAGFAADQFAKPGTANLTSDMLDEGTRSRSALEISDELRDMGATLGTNAGLDLSTINMSALKENLDDSLALFADVVLNPAFPEDEFDRQRKQLLADIQQERVQPQSMALRVMPKLMYGDGHAYSQPLTGSGTEETVNAIEVADLKSFHEDFFRPNNSTLIVVGDVTMDEIKPKLERQFRGWKSADVPRKNLDQVAHQSESTIYLIDRPDSEQSMIIAGHISPSKSDENQLAMEAMNGVFGGSFNARINMNLREDKSWAYGAYSFTVDTASQRPFLLWAPVQTDKTAESMAELYREASEIRGERPPTDEELARVKARNTLSLPGRWETANAVAGSLQEMVRFGLDDNHWNTYADRVRALELDDVSAAARDVIRPDNMIWVVVGDRAKIEEKIKALGYGDVKLMDADGNLLGDNTQASL